MMDQRDLPSFNVSQSMNLLKKLQSLCFIKLKQGSHNFLKLKFKEFQGGILTNFKEILELPDPN